jgi:hypothetical protein
MISHPLMIFEDHPFDWSIGENPELEPAVAASQS